MALFRYMLFCVLILLSVKSRSEKIFDFNSRCREAYNDITRLKLEPGRKLLEEEKRTNPDNLIPFFLDNYIDFYTLFFNDDPALYKKFSRDFDRRLKMIDSGPDNSPYHLFIRGIMNFQAAAVRMKSGERWDGGWQFRRAFGDIKKNQENFPSFTPNLVCSGLMKSAVSVIPDNLKWLGSLFGVKGNLNQGIAELEKFLTLHDETSELFRNEAIFYYVFIKFYLQNEKTQVFNFLKQENPDLKNNHLFTFMAANLHINNQEAAIAESIIKERNLSDEYLNTPIWNLELGYTRLYHLEADAPVYFKKFLEEFKGEYYAKDVLQKLSWHYYIHDDMKEADYYRQLIGKRKDDHSEADEQAGKEQVLKEWPDKLLLQVRLLNDGGYYQEALRLLYGKKASDYTNPASQLEFLYRVGRLFDDSGNHEKAMGYFRQVVIMGKNSKEHYAARAALQLGLIYEERKDCAAANAWFNTCLHMKDHDFKNALDQRAKAGINRCR
jgi:hypothetical protein